MVRRTRAVVARTGWSCWRPMGKSVCFGREQKSIEAAVCTCGGAVTCHSTARSNVGDEGDSLSSHGHGAQATCSRRHTTSLHAQTQRLSRDCDTSQPQAKGATFVVGERVRVVEPPANARLMRVRWAKWFAPLPRILGSASMVAAAAASLTWPLPRNSELFS